MYYKIDPLPALISSTGTESCVTSPISGDPGLFIERIDIRRMKLALDLQRLRPHILDRKHSTFPEKREIPGSVLNHTDLAEVIFLRAALFQRPMVQIDVRHLLCLFERPGMEVEVFAKVS